MKIGAFRILQKQKDELGVTPINWTAKRRNLECRSSEFLGLILYSDSPRLAVFLAKARFGRLLD